MFDAVDEELQLALQLSMMQPPPADKKEGEGK